MRSVPRAQQQKYGFFLLKKQEPDIMWLRSGFDRDYARPEDKFLPSARTFSMMDAYQK
jgi:hypothetical protein